MTTATSSDVGALAIITTTATTPVMAQPSRLIARPRRQPGWPLAQPVNDHARLADGERHEHADRVQRDERVGLAAERQQQDERHDAEDDDARVEGEPIPAEAELARHVAVAGEDRGQPRKGVVDVFAARKRISAVNVWNR